MSNKGMGMSLEKIKVDFLSDLTNDECDNWDALIGTIHRLKKYHGLDLHDAASQATKWAVGAGVIPTEMAAMAEVQAEQIAAAAGE